MIIAIVIAVGVMMVASGAIGRFVDDHPTSGCAATPHGCASVAQSRGDGLLAEATETLRERRVAEWRGAVARGSRCVRGSARKPISERSSVSCRRGREEEFATDGPLRAGLAASSIEVHIAL
jgi:hypothetical protein